jgi:hypothetical protein
VGMTVFRTTLKTLKGFIMADIVQTTEKPTFEKVWLMFQETDKKFQETDRMMKETFKETELRIKELGQQIGGLHNKFGIYNEGLFMPSLIRILEEEFGCKEHFVNYNFKNNGHHYEIDLLGVSDDFDYIVEIKSNLRKEDIEQSIKKIDYFKKYSKLFKGNLIIGVITATSYREEARKMVLDKGLYFISTSDDIAKLQISKDFKPKMW